MKVRHRAFPLHPQDRESIAAGSPDPRSHHGKSHTEYSDAVRMRVNPRADSESSFKAPELFNSSGAFAYELVRETPEERALPVVVDGKPVMQKRRPNKARKQSAGYDEKRGCWR